MVAYASVIQAMDRLGWDEHDAREAALSEILDGASRWVDAETGHRFYVVVPDPMATPAGEVRYFTAGDAAQIPWNSQRRGAGAQSVEIDEAVSLSQVATDQDGDGVYETVWTVSTDYWLGPINAAVHGRPYTTLNRNGVSGRYLFPAWENAIKLTGAFGRCTIANCPADIRELTLMVTEILARPLLDLTVAGVQTYKIGVDLAVTMKSEDLPPLGQQILELYRVQSLAFA